MTELYALYYVESIPKQDDTKDVYFPARKTYEQPIAASHSVETLKSILPHVSKWNDYKQDDFNHSTTHFAELPDNSKYIIRGIPYVC